MAKGATSETARMVRIQGWEQSVASEHDSVARGRCHVILFINGSQSCDFGPTSAVRNITPSES